MAVTADELGTQDIKKLLIKQAVPSSIGILFMSVNILIDTIFVGQWIGSLAIAAVTVVLPITFLISSLGMAIGVGGGSVLSRALGANHKEKALHTFGNQIMMTFLLASVFVLFGLFFSDEMLMLFGAKGAIMKPAKEFFFPIIISVPFLALCMMGNNIIRAEGKAKFAMVAMIIPAFVNIALDILFIKYMNLGMFGAALATAISYFMCFLFVLWFFVFKSELKLKARHFKFKIPIVKEITELSFVTFSRQGVVSILAIILNHTLYTYGGEHSVAIYGIISRMLMFALFPILGITQGFLPIAGFNYGAENYERVKESVQISIKYAAFLAPYFCGYFNFCQTNSRRFYHRSTSNCPNSRSFAMGFCGFANYSDSTNWCSLFSSSGKSKKSIVFDLKQTRIFPNSVSADSTKFFRYFWSVGCIPNCRYFINDTNWLFSKKRNEY